VAGSSGSKALARAYHPASIKEGKVEGQQPALVNLTMPVKRYVPKTRPKRSAPTGLQTLEPAAWTASWG
jgi:hypothetical protein